MNNSNEEFCVMTIEPDGSKIWVDKKGYWHRIDGPAYITRDAKAWCYHGRFHRLDGPAYIDSFNNLDYWYVNGFELTKEEFDEWVEVYGNEWNIEREAEFNLRFR